MQREEFTELTGIYPSMILYRAIEQEYMDSEQDKAEFCRQYIQNVDGIAEKIQRLADTAEIDRQQKFAELQAQLDKELEWKYFADLGTCLNQKDYEEMFEVCRTVSDETAVKILSASFGLMPEKIRIRHEVQEFELNKYGVCRAKRTFQRKPVYENCECNYIRFDCAGRQWELVNGELLSYDH
ncbi:MAG: hypothetical protein K2H82_02240 [Oscillospiraceae bacterium]|nr:hypothetical protein [Oscillospiraceae bacterium]